MNKTFESLNFKPLPHRINICLTSQFPNLLPSIKNVFYFNKKEYLEYPTIKNYFMKTRIVEYQGIYLCLKIKNWDCIFKMVEGTWSSESVTFHPSLPYFTVGCRNNNGLFMEINENNYNMIVIDVQGYEMEVFKGSTNFLNKIDYINLIEIFLKKIV